MTPTDSPVVQPWKQWTARTRESIALMLTEEAEMLAILAREYPWHETPVLRSEIEDRIRACKELWLLITEKPVHIEPEIPVGSVEAVAMGEEPAP